MYTRKSLKALSLTLVLMLAILLLGGCGSKTNTGNNASTVTSTQQASTTEAEATKEELKPVTLKWYFESPKTKDSDEVYAKANELIKSKINATVEFLPIDWGTFDQKIPLIIASGEEFDILFSAPWTTGSKYTTNTAKGAIIPVDELLEKYAPLTKKMIPQTIWDGCKINGKIYGVPNYQIMATAGAYGVNKAIADKYGLDPKATYNTILDFEPFLEKVKKGEPDLALIPYVAYTLDNSADKVSVAPIPEVSVLSVRNDLKVFNALDDQDTQNAYKKTREWYKKGYLPKDVATAKDSSYSDAIKAGKVMMAATVYKPGGEGDLKNTYGQDFYMVKFEKESLLSTNSITATMSTISKTSQNPERAMMLLELMQQDKELYNTVVFGIEGKHYTKISDNRIEIVKDPGYSAYSWMMGNQFLAYLTPGQEDDVWEKTIELNNSAKKTPTCGFTFDPEPVKSEIAQLSAITGDYNKVMTTGVLEFDKFSSLFKDKFEKAGLQKVKEELQKQLDAWKATK